MENIKKKSPKIVAAAIIVYLVLATLCSLVNNGLYMVSAAIEVIEHSYDFADFIEDLFYGVIWTSKTLETIGELVGDFLNSVWVILVGIFAMFIYRKKSNSIFLAIALVIGTITTFIGACDEFISFIEDVVRYGFSDSVMEFLYYVLWFIDVALMFALPLALLVIAIGAFVKKTKVVAKIGSIAYIVVAVLMLVSGVVLRIFVLIWNFGYIEYMLRDIDWAAFNYFTHFINGTAIDFVGLLPAIALVILFFKYMKKGKAEEPVAEIEETVAEVVAE